MREARQLSAYGIGGTEPTLDYERLLRRVRDVVADVRAHAALRQQLVERVSLHEQAGTARFVDAHTVRTDSGLAIRADKIILCTGGSSRRLAIPGFEWTATHSDAWALTSVPKTMVVLGGGATGIQVASVFHAFGTRVELFQAGRRILPTEDEDVSASVAEYFRRTGIAIRTDYGAVERFEKTPEGVRMFFTKHGARAHVEAAVVVVAVGWTANTAGIGLERAGVELDPRGFVRVDAQLRTSAPNVFAAGDVTGRLMLVPEGLQDGFVAATNAVTGASTTSEAVVHAIGSFTEPEYAQAGLTEAQARASHDVTVAVARFDSATRPIIDGQTYGFCKLIVDRATRTILGCHIVGERAVDIVQSAAIAMAAGMRVDVLARLPLSFPTYTGVLGRVAAIATRQLNLDDARSRFAEQL
jgi:dihydrolipoamide dehydrogenase